MRAFALALLLLCSMSIVVAQPALAAVVELPVTYIGEVNQEGIDLQGITHRYGWRGALFDYKMAIAAELEDAEPFLFLTIFPYIESLVWYEARLVQYLDGKDDEFAQEYFEQASLYPDALLFQVAVAGDEEMIREDALAFFTRTVRVPVMRRRFTPTNLKNRLFSGDTRKRPFGSSRSCRTTLSTWSGFACALLCVTIQGSRPSRTRSMDLRRRGFLHGDFTNLMVGRIRGENRCVT